VGYRKHKLVLGLQSFSCAKERGRAAVVQPGACRKELDVPCAIVSTSATIVLIANPLRQGACRYTHRAESASECACVDALLAEACARAECICT
jgi:hypothetical protein